jgi:hypothetical protein
VATRVFTWTGLKGGQICVAFDDEHFNLILGSSRRAEGGGIMSVVERVGTR